MPALQLSELTLRQFRSHEDFSMQFSSSLTVITGANGSGKTSVIEAIYILLRGASFRGSDKDIVQYNHDSYKITGDFNDSRRILRYYRDTGKQYAVDGHESKRLLATSKYPVVLFEPSDLQLIHGSPNRRRRYIDQFISGYTPGYDTVLRKYERALKQRNSLLKKGVNNHKELFSWDVLLSDYGAQIIKQRNQAVAMINQLITDQYRQIAGTDDSIDLNYSYTVDSDNITEQIHSDLAHSFAIDRLTGSTSVGPHRHDVVIQFNKAAAATNASRGEIRSIILALKTIELELLYDKTGHAPLLLLDDVFSELDTARQEKLLRSRRHSQTIITTVGVDHLLIQDDFSHVTI